MLKPGKRGRKLWGGREYTYVYIYIDTYAYIHIYVYSFMYFVWNIVVPMSVGQVHIGRGSRFS